MSTEAMDAELSVLALVGDLVRRRGLSGAAAVLRAALGGRSIAGLDESAVLEAVRHLQVHTTGNQDVHVVAAALRASHEHQSDTITKTEEEQ